MKITFNIYFVLMFIFAFLAVENVFFQVDNVNAITRTSYRDNYMAILYWLAVFGFGKVLYERYYLDEE
ncbi:hypothetical protein LCGC14_0800750 [marine sediment metagenome]|uniref:DUF5671 domain-containing protein n=1 Tax=marine sediment metagenome TaxID=412755 RepID=A0A0F9S9R6_9ZZZZ